MLNTLLMHLWQQLQLFTVFLQSFGIWCHKLGTPIFGQFYPFPLQHLSSSIRLDGKRRCTAIFRSLQRCSIGFKSGLWLGHSRTFTELSWSHFDILAVCLGSLSCWKMNLTPVWSRALWSRFSSRMSLYTAAFILPSIRTSLPVPAAEQHPHSMMLPPPCFTVGMVLAWWWAVPGFLQTWHLAFTPKSSIFVSSDQRILFLMVWESFRCILTNSRQAAMSLLLRSGFRLATLPYRPDWWIAAEMVVLLEGSPLSTEEHWSSERVTIGFLVTSLTKALLPDCSV